MRFQSKRRKRRYFQTNNTECSPCEIRNDYGVSIVNFDTSRNLIFKSTMLSHIATFINILGLLMGKHTIRLNTS